MHPRTKTVLVCAAGIACMHGLVLLAMPTSPLQVFLSNLIQLSSSVAAGGLCIHAALRARQQTRQFWLLAGLSIFLWSLGQTIWTYEEYRFGADRPGPAPTDIFFFFAFTPLLMAMLLQEESDEPGFDWPRVLDALQVVILILAAYAFLFALPQRLLSPDKFYNGLLRFVFNARNLFVTVAVAGRYVLSGNRNTRALYGRLAIFLAAYAFLTGYTNYLRIAHDFTTGRFSDLGWSLPFLLCAVMTADWEAFPGEPAFRESISGTRAWLALYLIPTLVPFAVVAMAARIAQDSPFLAFLAIFTTFAIYSARLAITQVMQKRAEAALRQSEERFRLLAENAPGLIYLCKWDRHMTDVYLNDHTLALTGYPKEDFLGGKVDFTQLYHPDDIDRIFSETELGLKEKRPFRIRYRLRHRSGAWRSVEDVGIGIYRDGEVELIEGFISDVTERLNLEEQLRQSQKMEAVGTLAGGIAHDFNNLLTVITGYIRLLLEQFGEDEKVGQQLHQVGKAADRAASLTAQLLAFSRRQVLQPKNLSLNEIVFGLEMMLHRIIGENIEVKIALDPELYLVKADPGQIEQVILNLASNARDAMPAGGVLEFSSLNRELSEADTVRLGVPPGSYACLVVRDNGHGMPEGTLSHIFEPFFSTKEEKGTGLGLSTVYGIVKQSRGAIAVESVIGKGTSFLIYLPRSGVQVAEPKEEMLEKPSTGGSETVLLVEDDPELRELVRRVLAMNGYHVLTASKGDVAVPIAQEYGDRIRLVISDVIMPGMSGKELAQKIAFHVPNIRVLFISGYTDNIISDEGTMEPGRGFLQKPFTPSALIQRVREMLDTEYKKG